MKAGIIGLFESDASEPPESGTGPAGALEVEEELTDLDGNSAYVGKMAGEKEVEIEQAYIHGGPTIEVLEEPVTRPWHCEFVAAPGEFVVLGHGAEPDAWDRISNAMDGIVSQATLDLNQFAHDHPVSKTWQLGFDDRPGEAEKGVVYSAELEDLQDDTIGSDLRGTTFNQLGLRYDGYRVTMARSGYVAVYHPGSMTTEEFVRWLRDDVLEHARIPVEEEDDTEQEELT